MKLSDAYIEKNDSPMLELVVKVMNINPSEGNEILARCRPLYEYSWLIQRIKEYMLRQLSRDEAIIRAIQDCEREGMMQEFVREHGSEAINMLFTQWNMEDALAVSREEGREEGGSLVLIKQVQKKLTKGKSEAVIAEELEAESAAVMRICEAIRSCGVDRDAEEIYRVLQDV